MQYVPADLSVSKPLKQREETQLGGLLNALAKLPGHILGAVEAIGDCMTSQHDIDQVLAAVAVSSYEAAG